MKNKKTIGQMLTWFILAVALIAIYKVLDNFSEITNWIKNLVSILMPFLMGVLVAYLFYVPVKKVENLYKKTKVLNKRARKLSVLTVYLMALLVIVILINVVLPAVSKSVVELTSNLPTYYENVMKFVEEVPEDWPIDKNDIQLAFEKIQKIDFAQFFSTDKLIEYIKGVVGIASTVFSVFVTIVMSIYILLERTEILRFFSDLSQAIFKPETSKAIGKYFEKGNQIFFRFVYSQILDGIIVGIITSIAMLILGVKYAVLLGFMIGLFNIIPYFGAIIAVILAVIITIFTGGIGQAIWMAIVVIILQQIDANIINPRIVGSSLTISPILVIFAVTVGGAYFGVLGMFLAVPIIAVVKIIVIDYIDYRKSLNK